MPKGFPTPGHARLSQRLAGDHQGGGGVQRAGPLHRVHRLRVDLEHRRQQPAPQRHLPRQRRARPASSSRSPPCRRSAATTPRPVEVDGGLRGEDRRRSARHRAQRQSEQRPHVPDHRVVHGKKIDREYAETRAQLGAALRSRRRSRATARRIRSCRPTTSSRTSRCWDKGNLDGSVAKKQGHARVRVRPLGAEERAQAGSRARRRIPTSSA